MAASDGVRGKILLAAQEITFAKVLAGNDKPTRDRGVKRLRKWLKARSEGSLEFSEEDHLTLWKGLFYCMWMSDKPLVQEDLAEQISKLIHCFKKSHQGILFMKCFFQTMAREWFGVDQFRLDKFMMLVRRCVRQLFMFCFNHGWTPKCCEEVCNLFESFLINSPDNALGLVLHVSDIVLEELAKVGGGENVIIHIIKPWAKLIGMHHDKRLRQHVLDRVFHHLMRQSNLGIEFQDKFDAWKAAGFPGKSWREMEAVEVDGDENENEDVNMETSKTEKIFDPRAGKVDVELPQIMFDPEEVSNLLHEEQSKATLLRGRKMLRLLSSQFKQVAEGHYPLGFKKPPGIKQKLNKRKAEEELWKAAEDLLEYETEVIHNEKQQHDEAKKDEYVKPPKKMKLEKNTIEKDVLVKPPKKVQLNKKTTESYLSKSKKKRLRMKQAKQNLNKAKVKLSLTNNGNCENLLDDANVVTHKISPAEKHQKQTKCVPKSEILESTQIDGCNEECKPVFSVMQQLKKKRLSSEEGKSPKLNVDNSKKSKKSPLKEVNSNSEIKCIGSPSPKRRKSKVSTDIEDIVNVDSVSPQLLEPDFSCVSTEVKSLEIMQADTSNEEYKPGVSVMQQLKKKRKSLEERKSPKLNVDNSKKSKKSPLKEVNSNNVIKPIGSPSPKRKNNKGSIDLEDTVNVDNVSPQLLESDFSSTSTEHKSLEIMQADTSNKEHKPGASVTQQLKKKRQSSEERKSPKINAEISKKCAKSPLALNNSNNESVPKASSSPRRLNNTSSDTEGCTDSVQPQIHDSDVNYNSVELKKDEDLNADMCTSVTPLKHKNSPVLIKEPDSLRRSLRIRTTNKTSIEPSPIKSKSSLNSSKSKKLRQSESFSETSIIGSQVGAVLVQKFESGEGNKQRKRNSINLRSSVIEQEQVSITEPSGMTPSRQKTPVKRTVTKSKARKSTSNSTPKQNTSLKLDGSGKKVNIVLKKNMTQGFMEYEQAVKNSPEIPFDASKKPVQGVLKPTSVPSPLNPFYKLNKIKF